MISARTALQVIAAASAGVAIAWLDTRPGNDATGLTAVALFTAAGTIAGMVGRRPWLTALLVGFWVPLFEIPDGGHPAALAALLFAAVGAAVGGWVSVLRSVGER